MEYSLKVTSYFELSVFGKNRPRVEMPIYINYKKNLIMKKIQINIMDKDKNLQHEILIEVLMQIIINWGIITIIIIRITIIIGIIRITIMI